MPPEQTMDPTELDLLVANAKQLSRRYKELTGKPLGITGEVAEYEAAKRLGLRLACARQQGFDAIRTRDGKEEHLQIKARCIAKQGPGQKLPAISRKHAWESVIYVDLDSDLEPSCAKRGEKTYWPSLTKRSRRRVSAGFSQLACSRRFQKKSGDVKVRIEEAG